MHGFSYLCFSRCAGVRFTPVLRLSSTPLNGSCFSLFSITPLRSLSSAQITATDAKSTVYACLESRLRCCPISPNDALELLTCLAPLVHHSGVVQRLVEVVEGNACCLNPRMCVTMLERLLDAAPHCMLSAAYSASVEVAGLHEETQNEEGPEFYDAASRVALSPLHDTLMRCVMADVEWQLKQLTDVPEAKELLDLRAKLWAFSFSRKVRDDETELTRQTHDTVSGPRYWVRGVAVLLAFAAQRTSAGHQRGLTGAHLSGGGGVGPPASLVRLLTAVTRQLADNKGVGMEMEAALVSASSDDAAGPASLSCATVFEALQRCWWWSVIVCRGVPALPLRELRVFVVQALIESYKLLHKVLQGKVAAAAALLNMQWDGEAAEWRRVHRALSWLLTCSLPVAQVGERERRCSVRHSKAAWTNTFPQGLESYVSGEMAGAPWTLELRNASLLLASDFANVSAMLMQVASARSQSDEDGSAQRVRSSVAADMIDVAFRLSLQSSAITRPARRTTSGLTEIAVSKQLIDCVFSYRLSIAPESAIRLRHLRRAWCEARGECADCLILSEKAWCRLACAAHLTLLPERATRSCAAATVVPNSSPGTTNTRLSTSIDSASTTAAPAVYARLLGIAVSYMDCLHKLTALAVVTSEDSSKVGAPVAEEAMTLSRMAADTHHSLDLVVTVTKCWRAWVTTSSSSAHATWLQLTSMNGSSASNAGCFLGDGVGRLKSASGAASSQQGDNAMKWLCLSDNASSNTRRLAEKDTAAEAEAVPLHQLTLWITEAWAAALHVQQNQNLLDVCACWATLSAGIHVDKDKTEATAAQLKECYSEGGAGRKATWSDAVHALMACERRLAYQCADYVCTMRNLPRDTAVVYGTASAELRPPQPHTSHAAWGGDGVLSKDNLHLRNDRPLEKTRWRPVFSPAYISTAALRLLPPCCVSPSLFSSVAPCFNADDEGPQLPMDEAVLEVLRRTIDTPLSEELTFFQMSVVSGYVRWCDAASMHLGWCCVAAQDCNARHGCGECVASVKDGGGQDSDLTGYTDTPWWILTVEGTPTSSGLERGSDIAALAYLWSKSSSMMGATGAQDELPGSTSDEGADNRHEGKARRSSTDVLPNRRCLYNASCGAVSPLSPFSGHADDDVEAREVIAVLRGQNAPKSCSSVADVPWLRQAVEVWTRRYALRVLLFLLEEESWQRSQKSRAWQPLPLTSNHSEMNCRLVAALPMTTSLQRQAASSSSTYSGTPAPRRLPSTAARSESSSSVSWLSEGLQPILSVAVRCLLHRVEQLCESAREAALQSPTEASWTTASTRRLIGELLCPTAKGLSERRVRFSVAMGVRDVLCHVRHHVNSVERDGAAGAVDDTLIVTQKRSDLPAVDDVEELEDRLQALRLLFDSRHGRSNNFLEKQVLDVNPALRHSDPLSGHAVEEARALLTVLCQCPQQSFLTSPSVLNFTESLWHTCWVWLVLHARHAEDNRLPQKTARDVHSMAHADAPPHQTEAGEVSELHALVTCRVLLLAARRLQTLTKELVEYLCTVYGPAVTRAAALKDPCFLTFPPTAVEALRRQLEERNNASGDRRIPQRSDVCDSVEDAFFSEASLQTYEVVHVGRFNNSKRRPPCVWEDWMRELARQDPILQEHPLVHPRSCLTQNVPHCYFSFSSLL